MSDEKLEEFARTKRAGLPHRAASSKNKRRTKIAAIRGGWG